MEGVGSLRRALAGILCALALSTALACAPGGRLAGSAHDGPIVLVSIDTLRADHLPAYGYRAVTTPAIDRLAGDGIVFEQALSHYPLTVPSHASMLTGLLSPNHGVRDNAGYALDPSRPTAADALRRNGFATGAFVSTFLLRQETGIDRGFERFDCEIDVESAASLEERPRSGRETVARALDWVRGVGSPKFFLFVHLYEPHAPYAPPEPFRSRFASGYDGEIATADAAVGELLAGLDALGLYDRAAIALVSDHGEGLGDHGELQHGVFLYRSTLSVPLLLKLPGRARAGTRSATPVGLVDLTPTFLELAGAPAASGLDGRSLLAPPRPGESRALYAETYYTRLHFGWSDLQAVYEPRFAYIDAPEPELYDLDADPAQTTSALEANRRDAARLRQLVESIDRPLADPGNVDAETSARLASLGYLSSVSVRAERDLPDPKRQKALLAHIEGGFHAFAERRFDDAEREFRAALAANDKMVDLWSYLARALHKLGREPESVAAWERVLSLSGGSVDIAILVANGKFRVGELGEARRLAETARLLRPEGADDLLAQIDLREGKPDDAHARMVAAVRAGHATEGVAFRLAQVELAAGRTAEAVALLAPFAERAEAPTLTVYALALSGAGRDPEALPVIERALAKDSSLAKTHEAHGIVLLHLERAAEARAALERALKLDPKLPDSWNTLGVALYSLEGPKAAMAAWKRAIALDATQFDALFNLGLVAAQSGDRAEARRALERFAATAPPDRFAPDIAKAKAALAALGT